MLFGMENDWNTRHFNPDFIAAEKKLKDAILNADIAYSKAMASTLFPAMGIFNIWKTWCWQAEVRAAIKSRHAELTKEAFVSYEQEIKRIFKK
jgi:hypothetical protein